MHTTTFHHLMSSCRDIPSPKQVVQLLIWTEGILFYSKMFAPVGDRNVFKATRRSRKTLIVYAIKLSVHISFATSIILLYHLLMFFR
jgi:hypothetical protein